MKKNALLLTALLLTSLFAEEKEVAFAPDNSERAVFDRQAEIEALPEKHPDLEKVLIKGILIKGPYSKTALNPNLSGVLIQDVEVPGEEAAFKKMLCEHFIGKKISKEEILSIKTEIIQYFIHKHHPFIAVQIPEQDVTEGVVQFILFESKVGEVTCKNNRYFWDRQFLNILNVHKGDAVKENELIESVAWMNRNPFHQSDLIFAPGQEGTTDIELVTKDRFPIRVYGGADNTGVDFTGNARFWTGFNWGNAFWCNDLLSYQYTTSNEFHRFQSHYGNYTSFLPWRHIFIVYGGYATIHPRVSGFHSEGHFSQGSGRYEIPFKPFDTTLTQEISLGFDFKNTNSNLFFIGNTPSDPIVSKNVNLSQFSAEFSLEKNDLKNKLTFNLEAFVSPSELFPLESKRLYDDLRPHSKPQYAYGQLGFGDILQLPYGMAFSSHLRLQGATGALLPSEMFGLGGFDTVRGYVERAFLADNALCANIELHAPALSFLKKKKDEMIFLLFSDYGLGHNYHPFENEKTTQNLISVGAGVRYRIAPYLSARIDWGFKLHEVQFTTDNLGKLHVGITGSY
jgi:hemolysin activation/secretion protein